MKAHLTINEHSAAMKEPIESPVEKLDLKDFPYLQRLDELKDSYPALWPLVDRLCNKSDWGRQLIANRYAHLSDYGGSPGRCAVLTFGEESVQSELYTTAGELKAYLDDDPATVRGRRRLFILEDLEPEFVDVLGDRLGVDPLVFSEQMNTWSSTDSRSVGYRALPSMHQPEESFTLRYFEIRTLAHEDSIRTKSNQMTHAVNRRRIDRWRDIDLPNVDPDSRHATVRRCASFWTSNPKRRSKLADFKGEDEEEEGWDALILVDPPMDSCKDCFDYSREMFAKRKEGRLPEHIKDMQWEPKDSCKPSCLILEDPKIYENRMKLWKALNWTKQDTVRESRHNSVPYHWGGPSLVPPPISRKKKHADFDKLKERRNMQSAFDELVFYWTKCATPSLIQEARNSSVNSAYYLLKFTAQHWGHQLDLIGFHVYNSEWFADEHDANVYSSSPNWRSELKQIAYVSRDINYTIRQMSRFDHAVTLNMDRLGVQLGDEKPDGDVPIALLQAQKDFLAFSSRLKPLRQRVDDISGIANDAANLRASLKGIQDGEQGLRLSLFAALIFPLTLVASILSMADRYRPGEAKQWVFWAASIPFAFLISVFLMYHEAKKVFEKLKSFVQQPRERRSGRSSWQKGSFGDLANGWRERKRLADMA